MPYSKLLKREFKDNFIMYKAERDEINKRSRGKIQADIATNRTMTIMERALQAKATQDAIILAFGGR